MNNTIVSFIRANYMGANIIVSLVNGTTRTGEVVDGANSSLLALKAGANTTYINGNFIVDFV